MLPSEERRTNCSDTQRNTHICFFYGTLMRYETLAFTIRRSLDPSTIRPAFLPNYRRCRIKKCNYPAIIPVEDETPEIGWMADDEEEEENGVIGMVVEGLTDQDLAYLDEWEGDEYIRQHVAINPFTSTTFQPERSRTLDSSLLRSAILAEAYVWSGPRSKLSHLTWNYEDFESGKIWDWVDEMVMAEQTEMEG